jgi:myo-inositol-1(or 4)-monophosphatase
MKTALIGTGFPFKEPDLVPRYLEQLSRILPASGGVRRAGSAALDLCYLAEGILDGFREEDYLSPWDVAAGLVILQEAGGVATRLDGSAIDLENGSVLGANSPELHQELGRLLSGP